MESPCIIFAIYIQSNEIHNAVALIQFLLVLRCQLYMFRTVTVHSQELLVDTVCADCGTVSTKKLLRMDRYGPKHVELTPKY